LRNINLIPRKPFAQKAFVPLLASGIGSSVLVAVILCTIYYNYNVNTGQQEEQIKAMQSRIQQLNSLRVLDQLTTDYNMLSAEISKLKENRNYWIPVFELMSKSVPASARVVSMGVKPNEQEKMVMSMEFSDLATVAEYMTVLQGSSIFQTVGVQSITKVDKKPASELDREQQATANTNNQTATTLDAKGLQELLKPETSTSTTITKDNYLKMLEDSLKVPTSKSDEILNEMDWVITGQASKQQHQIPLPEKSFQSSSPVDELSASFKTNPFSRIELEKAKEEVESLKKLQIKDNAPAAAAKTDPKLIPVYQVAFELSLKKLSKPK
jgi:Tfp pilus assembly protein PilN